MRFVLAMSIFVSLSLASAASCAEAADTAALTNAPATAVSNAAAAKDSLPVPGEPATGVPADKFGAVVNAPSAEDGREATAKPPHELPEGLHVTVKDDRLSVNAKDQSFGDVIGAIANAAGFDVAISEDVFEMKLTTRFGNSRLERGIVRLLSLIEQRNYTIDYGPDGGIARLEVFGDLSTGQRTLGSRKPSGKESRPSTPPTRTSVQRQAAPPAAPPIVIKDRERNRRREDRIRRRQRSQPSATTPSEPEEPTDQQEILELDYSIRRLPGGDDTADDTSGEDSTDETPTVTETPTPAETPASETPTEDVIEEEIIPEGDIPPESSLMNAPYMPPSGSPVHP